METYLEGVRRGEDCTALDIQKSSSNILNSDNIPTHGDCAESLEALLRLALELVLFLTGLYFRLASWSCLSGSWAFVAFREWCSGFKEGQSEQRDNGGGVD